MPIVNERRRKQHELFISVDLPFVSSSSTNISTSPSTVLPLPFVLHFWGLGFEQSHAPPHLCPSPSRPTHHSLAHSLPSPKPPRTPYQRSKIEISAFTHSPTRSIGVIRLFGLLRKLGEMFLPVDERRHLCEGTISCASMTCAGYECRRKSM